MGFKIIFFLFVFFKFFDFLIIILTNKIIPYAGFFPYKKILFSFKLPFFLTFLGNFDGIHYLLIAQRGYENHEQAFFPLYPLLIKIMTPIFFNNSFLAGFFISNFSFLLGVCFFSLYLKRIGLKKTFIFYFFLFIFFYPTSFYFGTIYTEGLFFLLISLSLYFLEKNRYFFASIFAFFAALTRLVGIFLIIPFIVHFLKFQKIKTKNFINDQIKSLFVIFSPLFGLSAYCLYLSQTTGDPFYFFTSQPAFGANRSTQLIFLPQVYFRYFKIFLTAAVNFQYFVSIVEFFIFNFVFIILILDLFNNLKLKIFPNIQYQISNINQLGLNLFSLANLLLPTLTGTFSSIPRYSLFSLSFFLYLAKQPSTIIKKIILFLFFIFHIC
ncbi:MAG: hypothetical protein N2482_00380 [Patescibacteria group bacterium]|nr:hypothetical protein [Patescibacteria group bacterium]